MTEIDVRGGAYAGPCPHAWSDPWGRKGPSFSDCKICGDRKEVPKFQSSFDMESEYSYKGTTYRVRVGAHRSITRGDYFQMVVKCIGTVMHMRGGQVHEFPSPEVVKAFEEVTLGAKLVAAKWSEDFFDVLYDGDKPELCEEDQPTVWSKTYHDKWSIWWNGQA